MGTEMSPLDRARLDLEQMGEAQVNETLAAGKLWRKGHWKYDLALEFSRRKAEEREPLHIARRAIEEAKRISEREVAEMAATRRWTVWIAVFTLITAVAMVILVVQGFLSG